MIIFKKGGKKRKKKEKSLERYIYLLILWIFRESDWREVRKRLSYESLLSF